MEKCLLVELTKLTQLVYQNGIFLPLKVGCKLDMQNREQFRQFLTLINLYYQLICKKIKLFRTCSCIKVHCCPFMSWGHFPFEKNVGLKVGTFNIFLGSPTTKQRKWGGLPESSNFQTVKYIWSQI